MIKVSRLAAAVTATAIVVPVTAFPAFAAADKGTQIQLLNFTDFHGRIGGGVGERLAQTVLNQREGVENSALLSAGDNIGASTFVSSSQQDQPTIDYLNALGLQAAAVGNHEFDRGADDLTGRVMSSADFPYLAANVVDASGKTIADPYTILDINGIKVAVIGVVTESTSTLVSPEGIKGISFTDPTAAVNKAAEELEALPEGEKPDLTVVEAHLGPESSQSMDAALASNQEFADVVKGADASVDVIFTGHTHLKYNFEAPVPGTDRTRPVVGAAKYGEALADVRLVSEGNGDWSTESVDVVDVPGYGKDMDTSGVSQEIKDIIAKAEDEAKTIGSEEVGEITDDITRAFNEEGAEDRGAESTLGNLVADALKEGVDYSQLDSADFGITNPGGLRTDLLVDSQFGSEAPGVMTVGELNQVLPFANDHGVVTMTGKDVIGLFEEQWQPEGSSRAFLHLGISKELEVVYDSTAERGKHVVSVKVNGEDIDPNKEYRVATLSFLAFGGDNFSSFAKGTWEQSGLTDFEVWEKYFQENSPVSPDKNERQADRALDVIANGTATAKVRQPDVTKNDYELVINTKEDVKNLLFTVEAPAGYDVVWADGRDDDISGGDSHAIKLGELSAGEHVIPFSLVPNGLKTDDAETFKASLLADPSVEYWDNNPLPIGYSEDIPFVQQDAPAPSDDPSTEAPETQQPSDDSTDEAQPGEDKGDDSNTDNQADDKKGSNLPRTGAESAGLLAGGLVLLLVGAAAVALTRTRRNG